MKIESLQKWILAAGIVIVLNLFFAYLINIFYPEPVYETYCPREQVTVLPKDREECVARGGAWMEAYPKSSKARPMPVDPSEEIFTGYCDLNFTCGREHEGAGELYNRNVFVARVVLGMLALLIGFFVGSVEPVSLGLSLGGVISLIVGTVAYWSNMNDYLRVIVLGLALIILIWLGVKRFGGSG